MKIEAIPLLSDNYAWLLIDEASSECAVVDPSESGPIRARIEKDGLTLKSILATHHHYDHIDGIPRLLQSFPKADVICSQYDLEKGRVPGAAHGVADGESITLAGASAACLSVPGHTLGAVAYYFSDAHAVFTGDTLFTAGCGRLFEGTATQMYASLKKLAALPPETQVYCGHEYTEKNLQFSKTVFPGDAEIAARLTHVEAARRNGEATVPAELSLEKKTNPFLLAESESAFTDYRRRRNSF